MRTGTQGDGGSVTYVLLAPVHLENLDCDKSMTSAALAIGEGAKYAPVHLTETKQSLGLSCARYAKLS